MKLNYKVARVLEQRPEIWGILGKKLIRSLEDATIEQIDATLLAEYPWRGSRYLIVSTDGHLLTEVGAGLIRHIKKFFTVRGERLIDALDRIDLADASYVLAFHPEEEEEGSTLTPRRIVVHQLPKTATMKSVVEELRDKTRLIIKRTMNQDD